MWWGELPAAERGEDERDGGGLQEEQASPSPVCIGGTDVDIVDTYKYLGVVLDSILDWTTNTEAVYEGPEPALLPEEVQVLQCLQSDAPDVLSACCWEHHLLHTGVLGCGHQNKGCKQTE